MFDNFNFEIAKIFKKAEAEMMELRHPYVGSEHLLLAILDNNDNVTKILNKNNINYQDFKNEPFVAKTSMNNLFGDTMTYIEKDIQRLHLSPSSIIMLTEHEDRRAFLAKGSGITLAPMSPTTIPPEGFALIPTGRSAHIVCAWNPDSSKHYLTKAAEFIKERFENAGYFVTE